MPIVSRADCTEIDLVQGTMFEYSAGEIIVSPEEEYDVEFFACEGIDGNATTWNPTTSALLRRKMPNRRSLPSFKKPPSLGKTGATVNLRELMDHFN
jgi:hypothetical protein